MAHVGAAVAQIRANGRGAALLHDPEYLHQLRVGLRRLRSTLRAFRGLIRRGGAARWERQLRSVQRALGAARDWDELMATPLAPVLRRTARRPRALAQRSVRRILGGTAFKSLTQDILAWSRREPWRSASDPRAALDEFGPRSLQRLYRSLCRSADGIGWTDAARRHRVRIRLKRLRYGCDCFATVFSAEATESFDHRVRKLQHLLGELNDIQVQRSLLAGLGRDAGLAQPAVRARRLLDAREAALIPGAAKAWSKFEAEPPYWRRRAARAGA